MDDWDFIGNTWEESYGRFLEAAKLLKMIGFDLKLVAIAANKRGRLCEPKPQIDGMDVMIQKSLNILGACVHMDLGDSDAACCASVRCKECKKEGSQKLCEPCFDSILKGILSLPLKMTERVAYFNSRIFPVLSYGAYTCKHRRMHLRHAVEKDRRDTFTQHI